MRHRHPYSPIGKCKGCPLNLRKRCAIFPNPLEQWEKGKKCEGYMNEELHSRYLKEQAEAREKTAKDVRREKATKAKTEPHHDSRLNPGRSRW
jgi:hypothetical protein